VEQACEGDVRVGVIEIDRVVVEPDRTAAVFARTTHTPRHIDTIRFKLGLAPDQIEVTFPSRSEGGICENWTLSGPDQDGFFTAQGDTLLFGIAGLFARIDLSEVDCDLSIPFEVDSLAYPEGKYFKHPDYIMLECP
jgi:hypothetical protein